MSLPLTASESIEIEIGIEAEPFTNQSDVDSPDSDGDNKNNKNTNENIPNVFSVTPNNESTRTADGGRGRGEAEGEGEGEIGVEGAQGPVSSTSANVDHISFEELNFGFSSFHAMTTPVVICMILSALAVTYIQIEEQRDIATETMTDAYTVIDISNPSNSNLRNFGASLVNGLVIVSVVAAMTFLIVILYKYRCMKLLLGYMVLSSGILLGFLGGYMFYVFIQKYNIIIDQFTFYCIVINFAIVGTIATFYTKGIPIIVTQTYNIATSVILAWQLSHFNDWTAWTLLVLLALYDLCAVLTPCGPLKALINLMQREDSPSMPGLLYEARLPEGVTRPGNAATKRNKVSKESNNVAPNNSGEHSDSHSTKDPGQKKSTVDSIEHVQKKGQSNMIQPNDIFVNNQNTTSEHFPNDMSNPVVETGSLPFAICKIYKLQVDQENCPQFIKDKYHPTELADMDPSDRPSYTPAELKTEIQVLYPRSGGRIVVETPEEGDEASQRKRRRYNGEGLTRYIVMDRNGEVRRVLVMKDTGKVYEELSGSDPETKGVEQSNMNDTIKLGLGDFIFYSVLVSKAALYSFTTFAACTLSILAGLGGTLVLLSVYHAALPALPISIFLGVIFYFTTRALVEPWIENILTVPFYV